MYTFTEMQTVFYISISQVLNIVPHINEGQNPLLLTDNRGETLMVLLIN